MTNCSIVEDERGIAYVGGTRMKVRYVVMRHICANETAEEIQSAYPSLSLAQVQVALRYYADNRARIDVEIADEDRFVAECRAQATNQLSRAELLERLKRT